MQRLILRNYQSPGDIVMLTAAVRDLHAHYPGQFITDVRTSCPQLWENNPHLQNLFEDDPQVRILNCEYPIIHQSNQLPRHFLYGFIEFLNAQLGLRIAPTAFKGDIHIAPVEKTWYSQVREIVGEDIPFWIIVAGGKFDFTIKWWEHARFQEVVDFFRGQILFVQVGEKGHCHKPLRGVLDLREKTDVRQFVRLMYHAQGVLCPVTFAMHLAAAVEMKDNPNRSRPCVVVAGGREPAHWEAYPAHQFLHTVGALPCCSTGGCWKSRTVPLDDGDPKDQSVCERLVGHLPKCMDLITPHDVIRRIELLFEGGLCAPLTEFQARQVEPFIAQERLDIDDSANARQF